MNLPPSIEDLNLNSPVDTSLFDLEYGLVIVSSIDNSVTMAALTYHINVNRSAHVITISKSKEYEYPCLKSFISQKTFESGSESFQNVFKRSIRETPDVIFVQDICSEKDIELPLIAAETGHLVFLAFNGNNIDDIKSSIVAKFDMKIQKHIQHSLEHTLKGVVQ